MVCAKGQAEIQITKDDYLHHKKIVVDDSHDSGNHDNGVCHKQAGAG